MNREKKLIKDIKSGDPQAIEEVYKRYKMGFLGYATRFSINEEEAIDIYQDSMVVLYENIKTGKLTTLTSSLKTYLFAIGKYKIYNSLKVKVVEKDFEEYEFLVKEEIEEDHPLKEEQIKKMQEAFKLLGKRCQKILKMFYYENQSIEEIKEGLAYASKDVVKSQKSRCIRQLKDSIFKNKE